MGYLNVVGDEKKEPAAISILMRVNEELGFTSCAALIRTQLVRKEEVVCDRCLTR